MRTQGLLIGFGKAKQADIATPSTAAGIWRMTKSNVQLANPQWRTEDNAAELGKGHEFATAMSKSHVESGNNSIEKYLSSEFAAWLFAFGLGKVTKTGAGPYVYQCKPLTPETDGDELPYFTYVEQHTGIGRDIALVGNAIKSFRVRLQKGPGKQNAVATVEFWHSGKVVKPSTIVLPAAVTEHLLNAYLLSLSIQGVSYTTLKRFESIEFGWDNALVAGYYPGSGQQNGYQIMGRMEAGNRAPLLNFVVRVAVGSTEEDAVRDLTTGAAQISMVLDANNGLVVDYEKLAFQQAELGEADGHVTISVTGRPMADAAGAYDVMQAQVTTPVDGICDLAA